MYKIIKVLIFSILFFISTSNSTFCLNPLRQPVEWFIIYKLPKLSHIKTSTGAEQVYMDSGNSQWRRLEKDVTSLSGHPLADTINQLSLKKDGSMYMMYNDQVPTKTAHTSAHRLGHTKGILHFNTTSGFWLVHSIPHFPDLPSGVLHGQPYHYPVTGLVYGQTILCVSLPYNQLDIVGKQLTFNEPIIFKSFLPQPMALENPNIVSVIKGKFSHKAPYTNVESLKGFGGVEYVSFAKKDSYNEDLYADLVAKELQTSMMVECWRNGGGDLPSQCSNPFKVENVLEVNVGGVTFNTSHDHSKWAISTENNNNNQNNNKKNNNNKNQNNNNNNINHNKNSNSVSMKYVVCIGDINRQEGQFLRGGGTVCMSNQKVWTAFKLMVIDIEKCEKAPPPNLKFKTFNEKWYKFSAGKNILFGSGLKMKERL